MSGSFGAGVPAVSPQFAPGQYAGNAGFPAPASTTPAAPPPAARRASLDEGTKFEAIETFPDLALNQAIRFVFLLFTEQGGFDVHQTDMHFPKIGGKTQPTPAPRHNAELANMCVKMWGVPSPAYATVVLLWDCDPAGNPIKLPDGRYPFSLRAFRFGKEEARRFRDLNGAWHFNLFKNEVVRRCKSIKQIEGRTIREYDDTPTPDSLFGAHPAEVREKILSDAANLMDNYLPGMRKMVGSARPDEHIRLMLAGHPPPQQGEQAAPPHPGYAAGAAPGWGGGQAAFPNQGAPFQVGSPAQGFQPNGAGAAMAGAAPVTHVVQPAQGQPVQGPQTAAPAAQPLSEQTGAVREGAQTTNPFGSLLAGQPGGIGQAVSPEVLSAAPTNAAA